jgi:hypothetical protein
MMKLFSLSLAGCVVLASITTAQATPVYFSFEALNTDTSRDPELYSRVTGASPDDPLSYVIMVDDDVTSAVRPDGAVDHFGHTINQGNNGETTVFLIIQNLSALPGR